MTILTQMLSGICINVVHASATASASTPTQLSTGPFARLATASTPSQMQGNERATRQLRRHQCRCSCQCMNGIDANVARHLPTQVIRQCALVDLLVVVALAHIVEHALHEQADKTDNKEHRDKSTTDENLDGHAGDFEAAVLTGARKRAPMKPQAPR
ncbi:hypothetical protein GW17_00037943 [Ensete ventricosum]|nr:hypothetical protein GW17_00037943 [Ensete ventricosum]